MLIQQIDLHLLLIQHIDLHFDLEAALVQRINLHFDLQFALIRRIDLHASNHSWAIPNQLHVSWTNRILSYGQ